jgi:hypothetical protein
MADPKAHGGTIEIMNRDGTPARVNGEKFEAMRAAQGVTVISNRCPAIEVPRLRGMGLDVTPVS